MSRAKPVELPPLDQQTEEWFMAQLNKAEIDTTALLESLRQLYESGRRQETEQRIELLQDTLAERKKTLEALEVLRQRARWAGPESKADVNWADEAMDILGGEWAMMAMIEEAGFSKPIPPAEAVRRLLVLVRLKEGTHVYDRTWGLGLVTRVDALTRKVDIDFERRQGHQMSFAYAAESLSLVDSDHILMWKIHRLDALRALVREQPAEVVRMALRSFGPLTVSQLQEVLTAGIVPEPDWKRFWDAARKALKNDAGVHIPSSRSEPLRLVEGGVSQRDHWFDDLARERQIPKILSSIEELAARGGELTEPQRAIVADRLNFALKGAGTQDYATPARVAMVAETLGLSDRLDRTRLPKLDDPKVLEETLRQLPARSLRALIKFLDRRNPEEVRSILLDRLNRIEMGPLTEIIEFLCDQGLEEEVAARFRRAFEARAPTLEMLCWLSRNLEKTSAWGLASPLTAALMMVEALEQDASGERLKAQNQLRERFGKADWLEELLAQLDQESREKLVKRIKESKGWSSLDRASVLGQMIKIDPSLAPLMAGPSAAAAPATRGPITSIRSFRARQRQLDRIVSVELPKVAKDIAIARSYGDLRENHEYKSAKEAQALLLKRRDELMNELRRVAPSDFKNFPADKAGLGTSVTLKYDDGRRETFHILGIWDGDPALGIISSTSRMAETLIGHAAGERLKVPSEAGTVEAVIESVQPLPPPILEWAAREEDEAAG